MEPFSVCHEIWPPLCLNTANSLVCSRVFMPSSDFSYNRKQLTANRSEESGTGKNIFQCWCNIKSATRPKLKVVFLGSFRSFRWRYYLNPVNMLNFLRGASGFLPVSFFRVYQSQPSCTMFIFLCVMERQMKAYDGCISSSCSFTRAVTVFYWRQFECF